MVTVRVPHETRRIAATEQGEGGMFATDIGIAFVILASVGLLATLIGVLVWLLAVIVKGISRGRAATKEAPPPTPR